MARLLVYPALVALAVWGALVLLMLRGELPEWVSWTVVHGAPAAAYLAWALIVSYVYAVRRRRFRYSVRSLIFFMMLSTCLWALYFDWAPWSCQVTLEGYKGRTWWYSLPDGEHIVFANASDGRVRVSRRVRPEEWWGIFYMLEFWFSAVFAAALVWSLFADKACFARMDAEAARGKVAS